MSTITTNDLRAAGKDFGALSFAGIAAAALLVSIPATYATVQPFHHGDILGIGQAVGSIVVFELGAFFAKVATLFVPWNRRLNALQVFLLAIVGVANYQAAAAIAPNRTALELLIFAAIMPLLQWMFLALAVARVKALHEARVTRVLTPDEEAFAAFTRMRDDLVKQAMDAALARVSSALVVPQMAAATAAPVLSMASGTGMHTEDDGPTPAELAAEALNAKRLQEREAAKERLLEEAAKGATNKTQLARAARVSRTQMYDLLKELEDEGRVRVNGHVEVVGDVLV